ncbi:microtubule-associated protein RP/EB family member 1 [Ascodesmis nigricans]|uniref:Microtubule-associated protein RP/EB family member 1 n=1 Tax=Ascodesmis nigricans TaxID=341454 RepID=A0A4S2MPK2_9PEZI|nr:microtubule-associated protein RP/EB family member 1 [Ascodesmis nigricans]
MGESRQELLSWLNQLLQLNVARVEQCGSGAALCQIFDSIYGDVPMHKVKFNARTEYEYLSNWKILTIFLAEKGIEKNLPVERLVKCKMQDNLEYLQWAKRFWDQNYPGGDYDAPARRKGQAIGGGPSAAPKPSSRASRPVAGAGAAPRTRTPMGGANVAALQRENATLKESVLGLEKERDFYFSKLRDIELLVQQAVEEQPELEKEEDGLIPAIQAILYATDDGFVIPDEEQGQDIETF